jgi:hypothetical protein
MIKSKVVKLENISSNKIESEKNIKTNHIFSGQFRDWPKVGECFYLWAEDSPTLKVESKVPFEYGTKKIHNRPFYCVLITTKVIEIIGDREFKTLNSIYKIITLEDERDERIKIILK